MSVLYQGMQTPTDLRIRKTANEGYVVEYTMYDPKATQPCQRNGVKGAVYDSLEAAMADVHEYLKKGKGCLCDDCDHAHHAG